MFYELHDSRIQFESSDFNLPQFTYADWMQFDAIQRDLQRMVKYKQPRTSIFTNIMAKVTVIFERKSPYESKPIISTKTFKPRIAIQTVDQVPPIIYNPYMKGPYVPAYDLWVNRWNW